MRFDHAREQTQKVGAPLLLADQWDGRARALEKLERWEEALTALRQYTLLREEIAGESSRRRIELLEIRHATQRRELELVQLRADNEHAEGQLHQARLERRTMIIGASGLGVFLVCLGAAYRWQRKATKELSLAHDRLQKLSAEKDRFLRIVAHDLRSPLGNIRWLTGMLRSAPGGSKEVGRGAQMIDEVAQRLIDTTDKLLELKQE